MTNESAQLNILISGGFTDAYEQLLPEFKRTSAMSSAIDKAMREDCLGQLEAFE
jgi:hypothetical protein